MAKDKSAVKSAKAAISKPIQAVKAGRVTKTNDKAKNTSKDTAKKTAKAVEKKSKKVKEPSPEPSSESDDDDATSDSSASSGDDSDDEVEAKPKTNGASKAAAQDSDSDDDSDSASDSDSEEVAAPKTNGRVNGKTNGVNGTSKGAKDDSSDSDDSDSSDDGVELKPKTNGAAAADDDDDDDSDSDSSDSDSDEEEEKPKATDNKKRKAESAVEATPKKAKTDDTPGKTGNLFVGGLSWSVDEEWLTREFEEFGTIKGVRVITDRDTGRSKGFGYVEFEDPEDAARALEEKNGADLDGRNIRIDFSLPRDNKQTPQQRSTDRAKQYGDQSNPPASTLFVGNLQFDVDENTVTEAFGEYGAIKGIRLPTDRETGRPKGFGYVEMYSVDEAKAAFEGLQGFELLGRPIRLDYASARPDNNSPGGRGGFGGRGGGRGGRGGFGDRGGRGGGRGGRGGFGDRGGRGGSTNRGGFGDFSGKKTTF